MVGHIFITNQIGGTYKNEQGKDVPGVQLVDIVAQVAAQPEATSWKCHITSPGGSVEIGEDIADYVAKIPNCETIAEELCASIATKIHLAVPLECRSVVEGTVYMIHNPLLTNVTGNAAQLAQAAEWLKPEQDKLVKMYVKATGMKKEAVEGLMNIEQEFTADQCVQLGFASKKIPKPQYKAVAFLNKQVNPDEMDIKALGATVALIAEKLGISSSPEGQPDPNAGRNAQAMKMETDQGEIETPYDDIMVGDPVVMTADGSPAPDGTYTLTDGMVVVVKGGLIESITPAEGGDMQTMLASLKKENGELKAQLEERDTQLAGLAATVDLINKKLTTSSFTPPASPQAFRPAAARAAVKADDETVTLETARERRAEYNKNRK